MGIVILAVVFGIAFRLGMIFSWGEYGSYPMPGRYMMRFNGYNDDSYEGYPTPMMYGYYDHSSASSTAPAR